MDTKHLDLKLESYFKNTYEFLNVIVNQIILGIDTYNDYGFYLVTLKEFILKLLSFEIFFSLLQSGKQTIAWRLHVALKLIQTLGKGLWFIF